MATGSVNPKAGKVLDIPDQTVTIGTASDGGDGQSASVAFTVGSVTTGGPVLQYQALSNPGSFTGTASTSPIVVSGLTSGTAYTFTVTAKNPSGNSTAGYSSTSNSVTPAPPGVFESIASFNPTTGNSVTFTSIPQTYKSLHIRINAFNPDASNILMQFNGNTGTGSYNWHALIRAGSTTAASGGAVQPYIYTDAGNYGGTGSYAMSNLIDIHDYALTGRYKTARIFLGHNRQSGTTGDIGHSSGSFIDVTDAITSIKIYLTGSSNFASGTSIALYGVA